MVWLCNVLAFINYNLFYKGFTSGETINSTVAVLDREGCLVCFETCIVENGNGNISGRIEVNSPMLWWPYLMGSDPGYLYTIEVRYICNHQQLNTNFVISQTSRKLFTMNAHDFFWWWYKIFLIFSTIFICLRRNMLNHLKGPLINYVIYFFIFLWLFTLPLLKNIFKCIF